MGIVLIFAIYSWQRRIQNFLGGATNSELCLPTAREGNVFRGVCQSFWTQVGMMSLPVCLSSRMFLPEGMISLSVWSRFYPGGGGGSESRGDLLLDGGVTFC